MRTRACAGPFTLYIRELPQGGLEKPLANSPQQLEFTSFWRTFVLLILLVALPSAGLSGFGVLAIVNERAAVERRLELIWSGKLLSVGDDLLGSLRRAKMTSSEAGLVVHDEHGVQLSDSSFALNGEVVTADDPKVRSAVLSVVGELTAVSERPVFFTVSTVQGSYLLAARREGQGVRGARLSLERLGTHRTPHPSHPAPIAPYAPSICFAIVCSCKFDVPS